jgi:hypothetical protein
VLAIVDGPFQGKQIASAKVVAFLANVIKKVVNQSCPNFDRMNLVIF